MGTTTIIKAKREAAGLVVTIEAPRLAKFVHDYCKQQTGASGPEMPEIAAMQELGKIWRTCNAVGAGKGVQALSFITKWRGTDGPFIEGASNNKDFGPDSVNLFMLRSTKALEGPVTFTFKGLYSKESCDKYLDVASKAIVTVYKELTSKFDKTVKIMMEDTVDPLPAVAVQSANAPAVESASLETSSLVPEVAPISPF